MSLRMFTVACWMRTSGVPWPCWFLASPRHQWFVPVEKTYAPLDAR